MKLEEVRWVIIHLPPTLTSVYNQTPYLVNPLNLTASLRIGLRAKLGQPHSVCHGERHNVYVANVTQTARQTGSLPEGIYWITSSVVRGKQNWQGVPAMAFDQRRG